MPLAPRVEHAFREVIRRRGREYLREGRVRLGEIEGDSAAAQVRGSGGARYEVALLTVLEGGRTSLGVECTCPHFAKGERCKHLWATVLELDARRVRLPAIERSGKGRLALTELDPAPLGDSDDGETLEPWERPDRAASPGPVRPGRPRLHWRARLAEIASASPWHHALGSASGMAGAAGGDPSPLLFLIPLDRLAGAGRFRIELARRTPRRDGTAGALRPARLAPEDLARAPSHRESALLAQLLQLVQAHAALAGYGYGGYSAGSRVVLSSSVEIPTALLDPLLPRLAETGRLGVVAQDEEPRWLAFDTGDPWQLRLELVPDGTNFALRGRFVRGEETLALDGPSLVLAAGFLIHGETLARADVGGDAGPFGELREAPLRIPASQLEEAMVKLAALPGLPPLDLDPAIAWREATATPAPRLRFPGLAFGERDVPALLDFRYGDRWAAWDDPAQRIADPAARALLARDRDAEALALAALASVGFASAPRSGPGRALGPGLLYLPLAEFERAAHELLAKGWLLEVDGERLRAPGRSSASVRSGIDFFELDGAVEFDGECAAFPALLAAARAGERFVRLSDGSRGLLPRAWLARSAGLASVAEEQDGKLRFGVAQASLLDALLGAQDQAQADRRFAALRRRLADFSGIEPIAESAGFSGTLREYQRFGLGWLAFLERYGLGGCLADDMGLGKTVQVLAHLAGRRRRQRGRSAPSLVVAPRSVLHGWVEEAARFAPGLRVLRYDGTGRAGLRARFDEHDLIVTTYGTLRRDVEPLREQRFDYAILDEAQAIKNEASRTAKAARLLRAEHRLALTGTPVENHLGELGSLLEFLNPGMLGRARGLAPLASGAREPAQLALLARALRPFLLRRTKTEVLRELPPKTEQTLLCELPPAQRRHYDELRRHYQRSLAERIERGGIGRAKIHVLEALLRLRQAACHPALVDPARAREPSAKLETLFEQLDEVLEEGHKALVFSQFTALLALVRAGVEARGIDYAYLDGRTWDRAERIERFQRDPACRLFLVSLKAGGTGLNLTAADYVFLLDPWWNPAVEAQAVDRAHRIGQERAVFAYRLVARDTVEEKILALQDRKRALAETILGAADESLIGSLSAEDLRELLG